MASLSLIAASAAGEGTTVFLRVKLQSVRQTGSPHDRGVASNTVIAWLTPVGPSDSPSISALPTTPFRLTQKNKQFTPHLLVIPTGSSVEFPNLDPFFHNVFSLFNGRRFDLGLYEAGSRRTVRFDHDGVSYIFCNIHPEMAAVIVSLSTPYYALSDKDESILLRDIPAGEYDLHLWSEGVSSSDLASAQRRIRVAGQPLHLSPITLNSTTSMLDHHLNKFGEEYKSADQAPY